VLLRVLAVVIDFVGRVFEVVAGVFRRATGLATVRGVGCDGSADVDVCVRGLWACVEDGGWQSWCLGIECVSMVCGLCVRLGVEVMALKVEVVRDFGISVCLLAG